MPRAKTSRAKPRSPRPRSGATPPAPDRPAAPLRSSALRDATEDIGDVFDEALQHLIAVDRDARWTVSPALPISSERLESGTLGWYATVRKRGRGGGVIDVGRAYLVVLPKPATKGPDRPSVPPLTGARWDGFASVDLFQGPPRLVLLGEADQPPHRAALREFTHSLFEHLVDELG